MASRADCPRGSGGCVLYPGTTVRIHGLRSKENPQIEKLNNQEGTCEFWQLEKGMMYVRLDADGKIKGVSPKNLRKVREVVKEEVVDHEFNKVSEIFQYFDRDGNGFLEVDEFEELMRGIGVTGKTVQAFLHAMDKNFDGVIQYEEFIRWALEPGTKTGAARHSIYWPDPKTQTAEAENMKDAADAPDDDHEVTLEDVEAVSKIDTSNWPDQAIRIINNMRVQFPDYPLESIAMQVCKHDFVGGKVMAAIRKTGTRELDMVNPFATKLQITDLPAQYAAQAQLQVYNEGGREWSFRNLRDGKLPSSGVIAEVSRFRVLEVKQGSEYGFCFGRIAFKRGGQGNYWVNLGLIAKDSTEQNSLYKISAVNFSNARFVKGTY